MEAIQIVDILVNLLISYVVVYGLLLLTVAVFIIFAITQFIKMDREYHEMRK